MTWSKGGMTVSWDKIFCLGLVLIATVVSLRGLLSPLRMADMDAYARANGAFDNYRYHNFFFNLTQVKTAWLPLHMIILGFSYVFIKDVQLAPRIMSLVFSVLSVPLIYLYTKRLFESDSHRREYALTAAFIYLLSPLRMVLATQPLSETMASFFLVLLLTGLTSKKANSIVVAIVLAIGCAIRFEFWMMIPWVWVVLYLKGERGLKLANNCFLCLIFPLYWTILSYTKTGNPFLFFLFKYGIAQKSQQLFYYNLFSSSKLWLSILMSLTGFSGLMIYLYALYVWINPRAKFDGKKLVFGLLPVYFFCLLILQTYLGTMEWAMQRYLYVVIIGMAPFWGFGIIKLKEFVYKKRANRFIWLLSVGIIYLFGADVLRVNASIGSWIRSTYVGDQLEMSKLVNYYQEKALNPIKVIYVRTDDWMEPMFVFLTQRHDIEVISQKDYLQSNFINSELVIIKVPSGEVLPCRGKEIYQNADFSLCQF